MKSKVRVFREKLQGEAEKRLYLPCRVSVQCPNCGAKHVKDYRSDYIGYGALGSVPNRDFIDCECGATAPVDIWASIRVDKVVVRKWEMDSLEEDDGY